MTSHQTEEDVLKALLEVVKPRTWIFCFGEPGVGKTTFAKSFGEHFGVLKDQIQSPTFTVLNQYTPSHTFDLILHFDLYRLEDIEELEYLGLEEDLKKNFLAIVEWSDRFSESQWKHFFARHYLPYQIIRLGISYDGEEARRYLLSF